MSTVPSGVRPATASGPTLTEVEQLASDSSAIRAHLTRIPEYGACRRPSSGRDVDLRSQASGISVSSITSAAMVRGDRASYCMDWAGPGGSFRMDSDHHCQCDAYQTGEVHPFLSSAGMTVP